MTAVNLCKTVSRNCHCIIKRTYSNKYAVELGRRTYQETDRVSPGPPLIISHGLLGSKANWNSLSKVFSKSGRKVIAVDARNHGDSPSSEDMDYFHMSEDILRLMDEENIEQACLLGHSMGGKVSMVTAFTKPERVSGLVVVDVAPTQSPGTSSLPPLLTKLLGISSRFSRMNTPLSEARQIAKDSLKDVEPNKDIREFLASNLIRTDNRLQWRFHLDNIFNSFPTLAGFPDFDRSTTRYLGPTLFVGGSKSKYITEEEEPLIQELFPFVEIEHIPDAGHWVHSENPSQFVKVVQEFLDRTQRAELIES